MPQPDAPTAQTEVDLNGFLSSASFWFPEKLVESAWLQHTPFAFWLMQALRPNSFVELGTHRGFSYLAFCQAVRRLGLPTRCFAVDTWAGDEHAGRYPDKVFKELQTYHYPLYGDFSRLVRSRFDMAVSHFADGSIDLLHIDGRHFYDDVKEDYEIWRPKLSDRAVVLFHDTNVREKNFGVWRLWAEISEHHPHFEFVHGYGLGVLGFGAHLPKAVTDFFAVGSQHGPVIREAYFRLGLSSQDRLALITPPEQETLPPAPPAQTEVPLQAKPQAPTQPQPALKPRAAAQPLALHIHLAAMAPRFLDVRTSLPLGELAKIPGIATSLSPKEVTLPRLPADQPKVAILQRLSLESVALWKEVVKSIVKLGWVVVTEIDDHPELIGAVHNKAVDENSWNAARFVHAVQTSTPAMAEAIRPYNPDVIVFPNAAFTIVKTMPHQRSDRTLRVFFGALNRERFSSRIGAALAGFAAAHPDVEFTVVHDKAFFQALGNAKKTFFAAQPYEQYLELMGRCDVVLMPLEGAPGESYKSDIKFVEASSLGVASIVSPLVYGDSVEAGTMALVAEQPAEWASALERLYADPDLRRRIATAAWTYVANNRMFERQVATRLDWYQSLWQRRHALTKALSQRINL